MDADAASFANTVLAWFRRYGRHDLPWQGQDAYRVWLSEIMLQQTQVSTVIPYYREFLKAFPNLKRLADADIDDVLRHWQGLGYYARARNLHKAAQVVDTGVGESFDIREGFQKLVVVRDNRADLGLLQHDFREPDAVSILALPRQIVAAVTPVPGQHRVGETGRVGIH